MKKMSLIALSLLSGIASSSLQPACAAERVDIAALETSINTINRRVQDLGQNPVENIIVVGQAGAGKSTLHHLMAGRNLEAEQIPGRMDFRLKALNPLDGFRIGHGLQAGTTEPCFWQDVQRRRFFDFPGLEDPRGGQQEILNAYFAKQLIQNQNNLKVIFAISESSFGTARYDGLANQIRKILDLFPSDAQLQQGLNVVITHQRDEDHTTLFQRILEQIIEGQADDYFTNTPRAVNLIRFLANNSQNRVAAFSKPRNLGVYAAPNDLACILRNIQNATAIIAPQINIAVTPPTLAVVGQLGQRLNTSLANYIRTEESSLLTTYSLQKINNFQGTGIMGLRTELGTLAAGLQTIVRQASPDQPLAFATGLRNILNVDAITSKIQSIGLLKSINNTIAYDTAAWGAALGDTIQRINGLSNIPQYTYGNGDLVLKGALLGTSDVTRAITDMRTRGLNNPINKLKVYSLNSLIVDEGIALPGTLVSLISPRIKIVGQRTINLCGANGINGADGALGLPGLDGTHGQHGGHLYAKANEYTNINGLTAHTKGGDGGGGGKGGNGVNGAPGRDASSTLSSQNSYGHHRTRHGTQGGHHYYNHNNSVPGTVGGNAGGGGRGGLAGQNGTALIEEQWNNAAQHAVATNGGDGNPGIPGIGGVHGRNHQGHYHWWLVRNGESTWQGQGGDWRNPFNKWETPKGYVDQNPPRAASGIVIPTNAVQQRQAPQMPLDGNSLKQEYVAFYNHEASTNPFVGPFPNLR